LPASLAGKLGLPGSWLGAAVLIGLASWVPCANRTFDLDGGNTYYGLALAHYGLSLAAACAFFAVAYLVIDVGLKGQYPPYLAWLHFTLTSIGALLILTPMWALRLASTAQRRATEDASLWPWQGISVAGYAMTLLGLLAFLGVLTATFVGRRRNG